MNNTISKLVTFILLCALLVSPIKNAGATAAHAQNESSTKFEQLINQYSASESTTYTNGVGTTEAFHQLLNDYVYGQEAHSGRFINEITSAINTYLATRTSIRMYYSINTDTTQYATNRIVNCINNGKPVVASMSTGLGSSWDHTCLVYGILYENTAPSSSLVYRVHMGWHQTAYNTYTAYAGWFYECGYLQ